jgi:hypothetical protein
MKMKVGSNKFIGIASILGILVILALTIYGKAFWWDYKIFRWYWWSLWFIVIPIMLFMSYKFAMRGANQRKNN